MRFICTSVQATPDSGKAMLSPPFFHTPIYFQRVDTGRACKFLPKDTGSLPVYKMMPR